MTHQHRHIVKALRQESFAEYSCHPSFQQVSVYTKIGKQVTSLIKLNPLLLIKKLSPEDRHHLPSTPIYWKKWPKRCFLLMTVIHVLSKAAGWVLCGKNISLWFHSTAARAKSIWLLFWDIPLRNTMLSFKWLQVMFGTLALNFRGFHPGKCKYHPPLSHQSCKNGLRQQD